MWPPSRASPLNTVTTNDEGPSEGHDKGMMKVEAKATEVTEVTTTGDMGQWVNRSQQTHLRTHGLLVKATLITSEKGGIWGVYIDN